MAAPQNQDYIQSKVNPILEGLVTQVLLERPDDPIPFMIRWLQKQIKDEDPEIVELRRQIAELKAQIAEAEARISRNGTGGSAAPEGSKEAAEPEEEEDEEEEEDDDDDDAEDLPPPPASYMQRGPRSSVSAEAYGEWNQKKEFTPPVHAKSDEVKARLKGVLEGSFLFQGLGGKDFESVIDAMKEQVLEPSTMIIKEGDDGEELYVIEEGVLDCYKKIKPDQDPIVVKTVNPGDVFGELALLYNCPRAASVSSRDKCVCWSLDRETFTHIVKDAAMKKRTKHEGFLEKVSLLETMDAYERSKVAEALRSEVRKAGELVVKQGEAGDTFYIVEEGTAVALKDFEDGEPPKEVKDYAAGDFFGELALLKDEPRAASVQAKSDLTLLTLDRKAFKRLLGPLQAIMERASQQYVNK